MFNDNNRNIMMGIILFVAIYFLYSMASSGELLSMLLTLPGLVLALTVHEFSHAKMADRLGDPTPEGQGRITLNPLAHLDPAGTICLLFAGFGWGRPVQINPTYFRNPSRDNMLVALAGPVSNIILAFCSFLIYGFSWFLLPLDMTWAVILLKMIYLCAYINLSLGVFNLLPLPPLDGSKILGYFLKGKARDFLWTLERYSMIILMILFITELPAVIISPIIDGLAEGMKFIVGKLIILFM